MRSRLWCGRPLNDYLPRWVRGGWPRRRGWWSIFRRAMPIWTSKVWRFSSAKELRLKVQKELYQEGAFAAEQTVTIFGPRKQMIANLRILGPLRGRCQVELSFTDARFLGINAPVRLSGDHRETPGCYLVGPAGGLEMGSGVIRAARHVHMNPLEAEFYGIGDGDRMRLVVDSEQGGALEGVVCRVSEQGKLEVHLDTDEATGWRS